MKHTLKLHEQVITAAGTSNNKQWVRRVKAAGGRGTAKVAASTTLLIAGDWPNNQLHLAMGRGLHILSEAQAEELLEHGSIDVEMDAPASSSIDELIGPVRSLFDQPPCSLTWNSIIELVDRCSPEQLPILTEYIHGNIQRWESDPTTLWEPGDGNISPHWKLNIPGGDLRVMPYHWITRLIQKEDWPAFALPRVLHLDGFKLGMTQLLEMLSNPHLKHLRALYLGSNNRYAPSLWKKLLTEPSLASLHTLGVTKFLHEDAEVLCCEDAAMQLDTLELHLEYRKFDNQALNRLFATPPASSITTLRLKGNEHERSTFLRDQEERQRQGAHPLPHLKALHLVDQGRVDMLFETLTKQPLSYPERVILEARWAPATRHSLQQAIRRTTAPIELLDISHIRDTENPHLSPEHLIAPLARNFWEWLHLDLPAAPFLRRIKAIKLGRWSTPRLVEDLEDNGTEVVT